MHACVPAVVNQRCDALLPACHVIDTYTSGTRDKGMSYLAAAAPEKVSNWAAAS